MAAIAGSSRTRRSMATLNAGWRGACRTGRLDRHVPASALFLQQACDHCTGERRRGHCRHRVLAHRAAQALDPFIAALAQVVGTLVQDLLHTFDTLLPQHEAGKIRILAVSSARRSPLAPQIPTFKESGMDLAATGWNTFFAPMAMPQAQAERLSRLIHEVMQDPDTRRKFEAAKMEPVAATQAQTEAMLRAYRAQWAPVVQRSGFKP